MGATERFQAFPYGLHLKRQNALYGPPSGLFGGRASPYAVIVAQPDRVLGRLPALQARLGVVELLRVALLGHCLSPKKMGQLGFPGWPIVLGEDA